MHPIDTSITRRSDAAATVAATFAAMLLAGPAGRLAAQDVPTAVNRAPAVADTIVDLRHDEGAASVSARWRYVDARIVEATQEAVGPGRQQLRTHDIRPVPGTVDFDAAAWQAVAPGELEVRRGGGRLCFGWYRLNVTLPAAIAGVDLAGATVVLEVVVDDYAEVWVDGALPVVLGQASPCISGWNAPTRVVLTRDARAGRSFDVAIFAANGPLSSPPRNFVWLRSATLDVYRQGHDPLPHGEPVATIVHRLDPALDALVPPGTRAERLATGFSFTEGPVWVPAVDDARYGGGGRGGYLLFSDPDRNVIWRFDPASGTVSIFRTKSGYTGIGGAPAGEYHQPGSNGLALDAQGRLTICEHGNRRVTRLEPSGALTVLAAAHDGHRLNSPNDLVYRSDGLLYFTDPPFGLPRVFEDPRKELPFSGVFLVREGEVVLAAKDLAAPNGLAFSPDEKFLYVDDWEVERKVVLRYPVHADGTLGAPSTFFDMTDRPGEICLDGLKVDRAGNVWVSGPGGIWILSPDGRHLGTVELPELPANFAFGDADGRTLYCCARRGLYRLRVGVAGARAEADASGAQRAQR